MHWYCLSFFVNCKTSPPIVINKGLFFEKMQIGKSKHVNHEVSP